jgi:iron complex outermembrane receptor protein
LDNKSRTISSREKAKKFAPYYHVSRLYLLGIWLSLTTSLLAQTDTTLLAPQVEVIAVKISQRSLGSYVQAIDSQALATQPRATLADLLSTHAGIFLKTYGTGSLATSALRGAGASHTTVLWNGFNLQNPMNGVIDFALFPVWLSDGASVQHGGGSSLHGSGSIGGAVFLENKPAHGQGWTGVAGARLGSFGTTGQFAKIGLGAGGYAGDLRFIRQGAQNDFPLPGSSGERQQHASLSQWAFSQNNHLKINARQMLKTYAWWQGSARNIPPSRTEANTHARQEDDVLRLGAEWTKLGTRGVTKARAGWFDERLLYFSDFIDSSQSRSRTFTGELEQSFVFPKSRTLRLGTHLTRQVADTKETGEQHRTRLAAFASWQAKLWQERLTWGIEARQELADGKLIPFTASSGASLRLWKNASLHARIFNNFNLPTFNDLYWQDAFARGNPNLKPETAWGEELGFHFQLKGNITRLETGLIAFSNLVNNWILWAPKAGTWQPANQRTVWARGLESYLRFNHFFPKEKWRLHAEFSGSLTRSTVEDVYDGIDELLVGKQLIYTPVLNGGTGFSLFYRHSSLGYRHSYTGRRFTTTDNSQAAELAAFHLGSLTVGHAFQGENWRVSVSFSVENIWNARYEAIAARPMPGRAFGLNFTVEYL